MRFLFGAVSCVVILASVVSAPGMQSGDDTLHVVLPKDAIRAIDRPAFGGSSSGSNRSQLSNSGGWPAPRSDCLRRG